jgi:hypothetical protein
MADVAASVSPPRQPGAREGGLGESGSGALLIAAAPALLSVPIGPAPVATAAQHLGEPDLHDHHRAAYGSARVMALVLSS